MEEESKMRGALPVIEDVEYMWIAEAFRQEQRLREAESEIHKAEDDEMSRNIYGLGLRAIKMR